MKQTSKQQKQAGGKAEQLPQSNGRRQRASRDKTDCNMIWLKVGFHTDFDKRHLDRLPKTAVKNGKHWRAPKNCWDSGFIRVLTNDFQGIEKHWPVPFNSADEIMPKLVGLLQHQGVTLHRQLTKVRNLGEVMARFQNRRYTSAGTRKAKS